MRVRGLFHSFLGCKVILNVASLLVPGQKRQEWLAEWRSELWHVWQACNQREPETPHGKGEATAFCLGAFKDAMWLRRGDAGLAPSRLLRPGTPSRCALTLALIAAASALFAYSRPHVWSAARPDNYHVAADLVTIARGGFESTTGPSIEFAEFQDWKQKATRIFSSLAFYQPAPRQPAPGNDLSSTLPVARASANLFEMLGVPVAFETIPERTSKQPRLLLRESVWLQKFHGNSHVFGHSIKVHGEQAVIAGTIPDESWRLPGRVDAWLLEDDDHLSAVLPDHPGWVIGRIKPSAFRDEPAGRHQMYVPRKDQGYDWFVCESLVERAREPLSTFLFALFLAFLALPATTSLPLGEYPANSNQVPWSTRVRRWAFLAAKFALIIPIAYFGGMDVAYYSRSITPVNSELIELFCSFWGLLFAFRWALRDQRKRCPVCLRTLTNPARVGQFSRNFLAWNGTELVCMSGHGLLHVPDIPTSWFGHQRWLYLDSSWRGLFPVGT
jgi:hypothetical protein